MNFIIFAIVLKFKDYSLTVFESIINQETLNMPPTQSRIRPSPEEANNADLNSAKAQLLRDYYKVRKLSVAPSELREIFSRTKCCENNCIVTKLRMPLVSATRSTSRHNPLSGLSYCTTTTPVSIMDFENMVWMAREDIAEFRVTPLF